MAIPLKAHGQELSNVRLVIDDEDRQRRAVRTVCGNIRVKHGPGGILPAGGYFFFSEAAASTVLATGLMVPEWLSEEWWPEEQPIPEMVCKRQQPRMKVAITRRSIINDSLVKVTMLMTTRIVRDV